MTFAARVACGATALSIALALAGGPSTTPLPAPPPAEAAVGGVSMTPPAPPPTADPASEPVPGAIGVPGRALLRGGHAIAPLDAPPQVRRAIAFANRIRTKPYVWGGGHGRWWDRGYDCSGAVSYALYGGKLLSRPLDSGSMMSWGEPGPGRWITIYANRGHVFAVIAGLRWDTSGTGGSGPRWQAGPYSTKGFVARHPEGF